MMRISALIAGATLFAASAYAADPVAMVEEVSAGSALQPFAYLSPGQSVALGPHDRVVIDYFASCIRETIIGGAVTVGAEKSVVQRGKVERQRVACDGKLTHAAGEAQENAAVVFRKPPKPGDTASGATARRIYARCPVVSIAGADSLEVERLDRPEPAIDVALAPNKLRAGRFYDFAAGPCPFVAGGTYRLSGSGRSLVFTIDAGAGRTRGPLVSRLLVL
jgi:hypothetical protein